MQKKFWENAALKRRRSASHPVVSIYSTSKLNLIFKRINSLKIKNILEIGCGNGFFTVPLSQKFHNIVALDFSHLMLSLNQKGDFSLICADALTLPFKDFCFDLVFSANLLHHVDNIGTSIREMKRVSKRYIVIIEPNKYNPLIYLFSKLKKEEDIHKIFTLNNLKAIIINEKIKILDAFSTGFISPNRTPQFLIFPFKKFNETRSRFGLYNIIIGILN